ncbi:type II secretion system major pseudopilin GspG [Kaarinaea lacus]
MNNYMKNTLKGFTLIELLVVMLILGLLAGIVGPQVMKYVGESKSKTARIQIEDLSASLDLFLLDTGRYPTTEEGLQVLVAVDQGIQNWNGPYLKKQRLPLDPWGNDYNYRYPGEHGVYDLFTLGADNAIGGKGEGVDINSWE